MTEHPKLPEPLLDDILSALEDISYLRLALDTLQTKLPPRWNTDDVCQALDTLRDRLEEEELSQIRVWGPREYLLIKPLRPGVDGAFADKTAELVRGLDDLGLIVRMII